MATYSVRRTASDPSLTSPSHRMETAEGSLTSRSLQIRRSSLQIPGQSSWSSPRSAAASGDEARITYGRQVAVAETPEDALIQYVKDTSRTRQCYIHEAVDNKENFGHFMPTKKLPFGVSLLLNDDGEHVISGVCPASPAYQSEIEVGSVLKMVDGCDITGLDEEEVHELTRHFQGKIECLASLAQLLDLILPGVIASSPPPPLTHKFMHTYLHIRIRNTHHESNQNINRQVRK